MCEVKVERCVKEGYPVTSASKLRHRRDVWRGEREMCKGKLLERRV